MWKGTSPNTAGSRFYLNLRPSPWRNGRNTVFGRVIAGQDVVRSLREGDEIVAAIVVRKRDHAYEPKTLPKPGAETGENAGG
jgi:cyclophilin family peptidyl-prolyl cis-trans isomerase